MKQKILFLSSLTLALLLCTSMVCGAAKLSSATDALANERKGAYKLYASDITGDFATLAGQFLNDTVPAVEGVDIDQY